MTKFYFAPLNKLGNIAFRETCLFYGADFVFSEMINLDKLLNDDLGQLNKLKFSEKNINQTIFQVISEDLNLFEDGLKKFLKVINEKPVEINFNMGCPHSSLTTNFCGAGILRDLNRLENVCKILSEFCNDNKIIPSIKIRIGLDDNKVLLDDILKIARKTNIKKVYIHTRFLKQGYNKPASPELIFDICKNFDDLELVYNGDIFDTNSYKLAKEKSGLNDIMIGRAVAENPNIFDKLKKNIFVEQNTNGYNLSDKIYMILKFLEFCDIYDTDISRVKGNLAYLTNKVIDGKELRNRINNCKTFDEIKKLLTASS